MLLQVVMALAVGGVIGLEREFRTGNGLRTLMLICLGATLFTLYGQEYGEGGSDPSRISSSVVTGVGFLGAAMILTFKSGVFGFTTAASVWLAAALGVGIGIGEYEVVAVATVLVLVALWGVPMVRSLGGAHQTLAYEALGPLDAVRQDQLHELMRSHGLRVLRTTVSKEENGIRYSWQAIGPREKHQAAMLELINAEIVTEFRLLHFDELI